MTCPTVPEIMETLCLSFERAWPVREAIKRAIELKRYDKPELADRLRRLADMVEGK